ncbi:MAG: hypothetical protein V4441_12145 [Pseudomonadota bacterium]
MDRLSFPYGRATLALFFVLASFVTLSNEAHCLGMSVAADAAHAGLESGHSHNQQEKKSGDEHSCHHEKEASALSGWSFLHQPSDHLAKPAAVATQARGDTPLYLTAQTRLPPAPIGTPPPRAPDAGYYADVFAATDRMLI